MGVTGTRRQIHSRLSWCLIILIGEMGSRNLPKVLNAIREGAFWEPGVPPIEDVLDIGALCMTITSPPLKFVAHVASTTIQKLWQLSPVAIDISRAWTAYTTAVADRLQTSTVLPVVATVLLNATECVRFDSGDFPGPSVDLLELRRGREPKFVKRRVVPEDCCMRTRRCRLGISLVCRQA